MTRFGPLHVVSSQLVVGDPGRNHLRFDSAGIHHRNDQEAVASYGWGDLVSVELRMPTTRFRFPGVVAGIAMSVLALILQDDLGIEPKDGTVVFTTRDDTVEARLDSHHHGGYWVRGVTAAQRIIDRLIDDAPSRLLLARPDTLVQSARSVSRR